MRDYRLYALMLLMHDTDIFLTLQAQIWGQQDTWGKC